MHRSREVYMAIHGEITPPSDKSISHRAFMLGALANGTTIVRNSLDSEDIKSTRSALRALGVDIQKDGEIYRVKGSRIKEPIQVIDAGNSGTTARLICGILAGLDGIVTLTGDSSLVQRPMARVIKPLELMGARFMARKGGYLPLSIKGGNLRGIFHPMEISSAQVKSALLLAGLKADGQTTVNEPSPSRDHTERMLAFFGATLSLSQKSVTIKGGQKLEARDITVPGDPSSAAFPIVWAASVPGSEIIVRDVCLNTTRTGFLAVLERMGARIERDNVQDKAGEPIGDLIVHGSELQGTTIAGDEIPSLIDEIPILVVAAALATGTTVITDAKELRVKETDRIAALVQGLSRLGAHVEELEDGLIIRGQAQLTAGNISTFSDHRIAMSFFILSRALGIDIHLDNSQCVNISYPSFFTDMERLR
jgi:3-phosphoshikimate 1-carboxyvinyltransferase